MPGELGARSDMAGPSRLCRCLSLAGLQCQIDSDWIADNGVFCLGEFFYDFATPVAYSSKTVSEVVDG